jgi:small GTP-binding protein
MLKVGLIGLPNAGKSTLFNAFTGMSALVASYPFSTVTTNKAMLNVADKPFEDLGLKINADDLKYSQVELWDIAGLIEGASEGNGLGNEFLGHIKDCDVLLHVVRGQGNQENDEKILIQEVAYFDHSLLKKPFEKNRHLSRVYPNDKQYVLNNKIISSFYEETRKGLLPSVENIGEDELAILEEIGLIGIKPRIKIINTNIEKIIFVDKTTGTVQIDAKEFLEASVLKHEELEIIGIDQSVLKQSLSDFFELMLKKINKKIFYTVGHLGVGQWITAEDKSAFDCSHLLHEEFEANNVKVATFSDMYKFGNWESLQKVGKIKTYKAQKYVPKNRDILKFIK